MPTTLFLLLTILNAPAVPDLRVDGRLGQPAVPSPLRQSSAVECRLRIGANGVPLLLIDVVPGTRAWFALDTGATGTTISADLARRLSLRAGDGATIDTLAGRRAVATVHLPQFRISGLTRTVDVEAAVHDLSLVRAVEPDAEGIVGHDVLGLFDYLIDYEKRRVTFGRFGPPAGGVRLPVTSSQGRPVLHVGDGHVRFGLVLDTGADVLVMDALAARQAVGDPPPVARRRARLQTHVGARTVEVEHHAAVQVAQLGLTSLDLVRLPAGVWRLAPEVGLLPGSLFTRVYVSTRTGEAALWPRR